MGTTTTTRLAPHNLDDTLREDAGCHLAFNAALMEDDLKEFVDNQLFPYFTKFRTDAKGTNEQGSLYLCDGASNSILKIRRNQVASWNWVALVLGGLLFVLSIIGTFLPDA